MNRIAVTLLAASLLTVGACGSTEYIISTTQGNLITTAGKPKLDEKTGVYTYKDDEGRKATINKADVKQIMER